MSQLLWLLEHRKFPQNLEPHQTQICGSSASDAQSRACCRAQKGGDGGGDDGGYDGDEEDGGGEDDGDVMGW